MKIAILNIALLALTAGAASAQLVAITRATAIGPEPSSAILASLAGAFALALRRR